MFIVTGSLDLPVDDEGWLQLPPWLAAELRRVPCVIEAAQDAANRPILLGLPQVAAPAAPPARLDADGRLLLPAGGPVAEPGRIRLTGRGHYFIIER